MTELDKDHQIVSFGNNGFNVVHDENILYVTKEQYDWLVELLVNPSEPNERLKQLFNRPEEWDNDEE